MTQRSPFGNGDGELKKSSMPNGRSLPDHAVIIVLANYNPGRINFGNTRQRFGLYRPGMTVGEYRAIMVRNFRRGQADDAFKV